MILVNLWGETCCLHLETILTEQYRGLVEGIITWCNRKRLQLDITITNELVVDSNASHAPTSTRQHRGFIQIPQSKKMDTQG